METDWHWQLIQNNKMTPLDQNLVSQYILSGEPSVETSHITNAVCHSTIYLQYLFTALTFGASQEHYEGIQIASYNNVR